MKKKFEDDFYVYRADHLEELPLSDLWQYPFEKELLKLLKKENHFKQEYFYIKREQDFAFFVLYHHHMNIFTFGKRKLYYPVKVIGFPCSLSNAGFVTNNEAMMIDYIKTMKGAKLILNVTHPIEQGDYAMGETLPTCILELPYQNIEAYMEDLRSAYRRRIKKAIGACKDVSIDFNAKETRIHSLYLNTYNKSDYKLERLEAGFFQAVDATEAVFYRMQQPVGFVLLRGNGEQLIFMLCGMDYSVDTTELYYFMIYNIIKYAIEHQYKSVDLGQTSEETKMKFGSHLEKKYFYAHHTNPLINFAIRQGKARLEYHYQFPKYRVFKEKS